MSGTRDFVEWRQLAAREIMAHERLHPDRRPGECSTCRLIKLLDDCGELDRLLLDEIPEVNL